MNRKSKKLQKSTKILITVAVIIFLVVVLVFVRQKIISYQDAADNAKYHEYSKKQKNTVVQHSDVETLTEVFNSKDFYTQDAPAVKTTIETIISKELSKSLFLESAFFNTVVEKKSTMTFEQTKLFVRAFSFILMHRLSGYPSFLSKFFICTADWTQSNRWQGKDAVEIQDLYAITLVTSMNVAYKLTDLDVNFADHELIENFYDTCKVHLKEGRNCNWSVIFKTFETTPRVQIK